MNSSDLEPTQAEKHALISELGFWRRGQNAFFDVRVTNANAPYQVDSPLSSTLKKHEREKKRQYNERVMQVETGCFTPLVFSTIGSMGPETAAFHKALAEKLAEKSGERYSEIMAYIRTRLSNLAIRSALLCLRGSRKRPCQFVNPHEDFLLHNSEMSIEP